MSDNKDEKTINIEVDLDEESVDLGHQDNPEKYQDISADELKQQAGELFKAAGGFAGSLGKFAAKKGGELKDKISDEEFQEKVKSGAKAYANKAGTAISSGAAKAEDAIKESKASAKVKAAQKSKQTESAKTSATAQGGGKGNKKLGIILLAVGLAIAGLMAAISGMSDETPATEEPVAVENVEETTEEAIASEEQTTDPETAEEPAAVYYSTNTEETVRDGNKGVYSYRNKGGSYDVYYIIDFDEGYVYSFTDGNGEDYCDKVKIDSGDLNEVLMVKYDFDGDLAPYGFHFKYKNNPEHLVVQDNDGFEYDFSPANLSDALAIKEGKTITER